MKKTQNIGLEEFDFKLVFGRNILYSDIKCEKIV